MMDRETIEKIEELSHPLLHTIGNDTFVIDSGDAYMQIHPDMDIATTKSLSSLDALVKMVTTEALNLYDGSPVYITVHSHNEVSCFLQPNPKHRNCRMTLYDVSAKDVPGWKDDGTFSFEEAIIAVRTRFQQNADTEYLLRLLSEISNGAKVTFADNGIATTVITQKGISIQGSETIRPIVSLKPYRTFQEVDQPESPFHIRISDKGIRFIESDGGMWKLAARRTVEAYLTEKLSEEVSIGNVVIML